MNHSQLGGGAVCPPPLLVPSIEGQWTRLDPRFNCSLDCLVPATAEYRHLELILDVIAIPGFLMGLPAFVSALREPARSRNHKMRPGMRARSASSERGGYCVRE